LNNLENDIAELIVAKHRNGPIGTINLEFNAKHTQFLNCKNTN
jgi:replicative DNA helicase